MKKRLTFFIASDSGALFKKLSLSRGSLITLGTVAAIGLLTTGLLIADYCMLRHRAATVAHLTEEITVQQKQLSDQKQQIKAFAEQINTIKTDLTDLNGFEEKIRIIADIKKKSPNTPDDTSQFGMGGINSQDIKPALTPTAALENKPGSFLRELHGQVNSLDMALLHQEQNFTSLLNYLQDKRRLLASTPAIRPIHGGWVTSRFAYRKSPFTGRREFHHGLDIAARQGTEIMATADGKVIYSGRKGNLGKSIIIDHGHGMITRYGHLQSCLKKYGEAVKREDIIGTVGNTGMSTGPHIHYEVRIDGVPVDPEKYILN